MNNSEIKGSYKTILEKLEDMFGVSQKIKDEVAI